MDNIEEEFTLSEPSKEYINPYLNIAVEKLMEEYKEELKELFIRSLYELEDE